MPPLPTEERKQLQAATIAAAGIYGIPSDMYLALITQESGDYDADIVYGRRKSPKGATGIAQFMPDTAREYGIDPYDPYASLAAGAKYVADKAKIFNNGKLPPVTEGDEGWKTSEVWRKAIAAYNAGQGGVTDAVQKATKKAQIARGIAPVAAGTSNVAPVYGAEWEKELEPETQKMLQVVFGSGPVTSVTTPSEAGRFLQEQVRGGSAAALGGPRPTLPAGTSIGRPNPDNFMEQDEQGNWFLNELKLQQATQAWLQSRQMEREFDLGPLSQIVDDTIQEIAHEISTGQLSLTKATTLLNNRLNAFKAGQEGMQSDAYKYGAPAGQPYLYGHEPGGFWAQRGLAPIPSSGVEYDPMSAALELARQGEADLNAVQIPQVPSYSSMRQAAYNQAPPPTTGTPAPNPTVATTSGPPATPALNAAPDPTLIFEEALRRARALDTVSNTYP